MPIQGDGICNITLCKWICSFVAKLITEIFTTKFDIDFFPVDVDFYVRFNGKAVTRNGKTYLKAENVKMAFSLSRLIFDLSNLYNGDKLLGANTNLFLNQNWLEVFTEIKKSVFSAFSQITENVLNNIFSKVPYDELFYQGP